LNQRSACIPRGLLRGIFNLVPRRKDDGFIPINFFRLAVSASWREKNGCFSREAKRMERRQTDGRIKGVISHGATELAEKDEIPTYLKTLRAV